MKPLLRIQWRPQGCRTKEEYEANADYCMSLGLPEVRQNEKMGRLAVVAGGPSVIDHIPALARWDGEIWAVNGAHRFLHEQDIDSVFFTVDALPGTAALADRARLAIVASSCDPSLFDALEGRDVRICHVDDVAGKPFIPGGATSVAKTPFLALHMGFYEVHFFGCDGGFQKQTHAYQHDPGPDIVIVECAGETWATYPDYLMQTEFLAEAMKRHPQFINRSGGLLAAMLKDPDYTIKAVAPHIAEKVGL